ncbi:PQQ-binding-like beta-propeller repeat protein [Jiangella sp. DSM 45060]|uniref:PQQ-binding-like beta-propeller repeat protein n=1 Tax=Jiangella sp. DSM 45060 TaxID=1798224 RepID=UPI000B80747C|nr:PQQ-binding-like beta-propeller repeat protein [Jiangella sp. DSM 45060]
MSRPPTRLLALAVAVMLVLAGAALALPRASAADPGAAATAAPPALPPNPEPEDVLAQDPRLSYTGTPVTSRHVQNTLIGLEDGAPRFYAIFRGAGDSEAPATFVVADATTGEIVRTFGLPGADFSMELRASTDGRIYFVTTTDNNLWVYDPATTQLRKIGLVNPESPRDGNVWSLAAAEDGRMYLGSYPNGYLYRYDPADDSITNLGAVDPSQPYIKALAYDLERGNLYVGVGGNRAQLYKVAPDGTKTALLSDETTPGAMDESFISTFTFVDGRLFARGGSSQLLVINADDEVEYWTGTGREAFGYHVAAVPGAPARYVFSSASGTFAEYDAATRSVRDLGVRNHGVLNDSWWTQLDDPAWPGWTMVAATNNGTTLYNPQTATSAAHPVEYRNPVLVQKILTGPDSLYASGYPTGLTPFSADGEIGDTLQSGQYESSAVRDGKMLLGAYGNGKLLEYDPASGAAPKLLFDLKAENQDRPFGMAYDEQNDRVFVGTVAYYGHHQGALTQYDFGTGTKTVHTTEVVTDQSVISVLYHDGLVYAGTTIDGGLGAPPSTQTEAHFVVFDPDTGQKVHDFVPVAGDEGVTGLMLGPDGLIWGVSEDTVFKYDPAQEQIVYSEKLLGHRYGSSTVWAYAYLRTGADGNVYGTNRNSLFRIDPETMEYTLLVNGVGNYANVDADGDIVFSSGIHVYEYDVPDPVVCDTTIADGHDGPLTVTEGTTCVTGATVAGPVSVGAGAGLVVTDAEVTGSVRADAAALVTITDSSIGGLVSITGTTSVVTLSGNDITGPVRLVDNTAAEPPVVAGNTITGALVCVGNEPPPTDDGTPNTVTGLATRQCANL